MDSVPSLKMCLAQLLSHDAVARSWSCYSAMELLLGHEKKWLDAVHCFADVEATSTPAPVIKSMPITVSLSGVSVNRTTLQNTAETR